MVENTFRDAERLSACRLVDFALSEDLSTQGDLTCQALVSPSQRATVQVVARSAGVLAGSPVGRIVFETLDRGSQYSGIQWRSRLSDGDRVVKGSVIADVSGPLGSLLTGERTMLNFMTHLSGIATITRRFVDAVAGTKANILDTRKTLPGWRLLEKYAVRCGGGTNHRMGLYDGILIKDNHLAAWTESSTIAQAVRTARSKALPGIKIEVEVDTLAQLEDALNGSPDIVLLDNMTPDLMIQAVAIRDRTKPQVQLEASGGITLDSVRSIAETGVERISVGALTHSAPALDLAFDWKSSIAD